MHIPYMSVAPLKIRIAYTTVNVVLVKKTTVNFQVYKGKEDLDVKILINYYISNCLSQTPYFYPKKSFILVKLISISFSSSFFNCTQVALHNMGNGIIKREEEEEEEVLAIVGIVEAEYCFSCCCYSYCVLLLPLVVETAACACGRGEVNTSSSGTCNKPSKEWIQNVQVSLINFAWTSFIDFCNSIWSHTYFFSKLNRLLGQCLHGRMR